MFSGVGKTVNELELALRSGILLFNVESEGELELLAASAAKLRKTANIALRVNPDVPAETHPYISTGLREHKFGVPISSARELCRRAAQHKYLRVAGVSLHIGSQIGDVTPFHLAMERAVDLVLQLLADGHAIRFIDAGGGLGISYSSAAPVDFTELSPSLCRGHYGAAPAYKEASPAFVAGARPLHHRACGSAGYACALSQTQWQQAFYRGRCRHE